MKATKVALGISNLTWHNQKAKHGPTLRFSRTMRVDLEDGRILGDTIPGFTCHKTSVGEYKIHAPVHRLSPGATYRCALITKDDAELILTVLGEGGYLKKIGTNNPLASLKDLKPDFSSELPRHVTHV